MDKLLLEGATPIKKWREVWQFRGLFGEERAGVGGVARFWLFEWNYIVTVSTEGIVWSSIYDFIHTYPSIQLK